MGTDDAESDSLDANDRLRERLRWAKDKAQPTVASARRQWQEVGEPAVKRAADTTRKTVDDAYRTVTFTEWREQMESMLAEVTEVLTALDARVQALEARVEQLDTTADRDDSDESG